MHFVNELTSIGKLNVLKSYIKNIFNIDYKDRKNSSKTIHEELVQNLYVLVKQVYETDQVLMIHILKTCWFYFEITIKSICMYLTAFANEINTERSATNKNFSSDFYLSIGSLFELLTELIIKHASNTKLKDAEIINAYKSCNRSLAMFIKVSLQRNLINKRALTFFLLLFCFCFSRKRWIL